MKGLRLTLIVGLLSACATAPRSPDPGEVFLGQVSYIATPDEASHGFRYVGRPDEALDGVLPRWESVPPANSLMASCGYEQSTETKFLLVRFYYYWTDSKGRDLRSFSRWTMVEAGLPVETGNMVEVEVRPGLAKSRCAVTKKIRAVSLKAGECAYLENKKGAFASAMAAVSPYGGSASFYCPFIETEGWKSRPLGPFGGIGGFVWSKAD
jgi:hypothetical protein